MKVGGGDKSKHPKSKKQLIKRAIIERKNGDGYTPVAVKRAFIETFREQQKINQERLKNGNERNGGLHDNPQVGNESGAPAQQDS